MPETMTEHDPVLTPVKMNLVKPNEPVTVKVTKNDICTVSSKAAGFVRHIEFDVAGTPLEGACHAGQAIGVRVPGEDEAGKPHKVRLYSLASSLKGEKGDGAVYSTTVKRTIDEHWETNALFLGVASNYLCDRQVGDEIQLTGPAGKRFVLPEDVHAHEYTFFATGTGIAPFRGMIRQLMDEGCENKITLIMGAPYKSDLLYHDDFLALAEAHPNFRYYTAISRERQEDGHDRMYVQDRLLTNRDELLPQISSERNLIYICGLTGMELGIFAQMVGALHGEKLRQYIDVDPSIINETREWERSMINRQIKPTKRVLMEVYD